MTTLEQDYQEIKDWLDLQSDEVQKHSAIVDTDIVGQDYFLHIDKATPAVFWPMMPRSACKSEDNTAARITVAAHLIGCYIGYGRVGDDWHEGHDKDDPVNKDYRGGYEICSLPFRHALQIKNELVPDAARSQEHWLVCYNQDTREYPSTKVGKVFVTQMVQQACNGAYPVTSITMYVEVTKVGGILFSPKIRLKVGFHKVEVLWTKVEQADSRQEENYKVTCVDKGEYEQAKSRCAALLDYAEPACPKPGYTKW